MGYRHSLIQRRTVPIAFGHVVNCLLDLYISTMTRSRRAHVPRRMNDMSSNIETAEDGWDLHSLSRKPRCLFIVGCVEDPTIPPIILFRCQSFAVKCCTRGRSRLRSTAPFTGSACKVSRSTHFHLPIANNVTQQRQAGELPPAAIRACQAGAKCIKKPST